jgi:primosomal protein N'
MTHRCPACDLEMEYQEDESDVGVVGGYYCHHCNISIPAWEYDDEIDPPRG